VLSDVGITVQVWTGREVRALREAKRMSIRAFSAHLGVSERMVSKWEKGCENIRPRPVNQHALDSSLAASGAEVQARFSVLLADSTAHQWEKAARGPAGAEATSTRGGTR
jgi:DNA-binding transcriptional regulator YiaG